MRYIVAKRKLIKKVDNLDGTDLEQIDRALNISQNFTKKKKEPIMELKKILSKRAENQQDQESDRIIEEMVESNSQVARNSKILRKLQSDSKFDAPLRQGSRYG